jgi:hypothetical protein
MVKINSKYCKRNDVEFDAHGLGLVIHSMVKYIHIEMICGGRFKDPNINKTIDSVYFCSMQEPTLTAKIKRVLSWL